MGFRMCAGLPGRVYCSMRHIRNRHLHWFSYVRWASRSGYCSLMHIRNRLLLGFSYVRRAPGRVYCSMMHIRKRYSRSVSWVINERKCVSGSIFMIGHLFNLVNENFLQDHRTSCSLTEVHPGRHSCVASPFRLARNRRDFLEM